MAEGRADAERTQCRVSDGRLRGMGDKQLDVGDNVLDGVAVASVGGMLRRGRGLHRQRHWRGTIKRRGAGGTFAGW